MSKVAKFGGSSVKDAAAFIRCLNIIESDQSIALVILSATYNTTNELEELFESKSRALKESIVNRHQSLAKELNLDDLSEFWAQVNDRLENYEGRDDLLSVGEFLSSYLFYSFLKKCSKRHVEFKDARHYIVTDENYGRANPLISEIKKRCSSINKDALTITQGFIGATEQGKTTVLGREGSDYSAALFAEAIEAKEVQIWTDVDGVYTADPRLVTSARSISYLSYEQASLLACHGAKVLFPNTLAPAKRGECLVRVLSSLSPDLPGTKIGAQRSHFVAVTCQKVKGQMIYTLVGHHQFDDNNYDGLEIIESLSDKTQFLLKTVSIDQVAVLNYFHNKYCL